MEGQLEGYKYFWVVSDWWQSQCTGLKEVFAKWYARQGDTLETGMKEFGLHPAHIHRSCHYKGQRRTPSTSRWRALAKLSLDVASSLGLMYLLYLLAQVRAADMATRGTQQAFLQQVLHAVQPGELQLLPDVSISISAHTKPGTGPGQMGAPKTTAPENRGAEVVLATCCCG